MWNVGHNRPRTMLHRTYTVKDSIVSCTIVRATNFGPSARRFPLAKRPHCSRLRAACSNRGAAPARARDHAM